MLSGIEQLESIKASDWSQIRDITIPIVRDRGSAFSADLSGAIAFKSSHNAYRLCDPASAIEIIGAVELVEQAQRFLDKGFKRFRLQHRGMCFRVQLGANADSMDLQMRVMPDETPHLSSLNLPSGWREMLTGSALIGGGLVLITAPNGQGKTVTASAMVRSRLEKFGGMANTVEDPIELPLQGVWGKGVCFQRPASAEAEATQPGAGFYHGLMDALRQFPAISGGTMLFVGEIRDALTAAETLKAAMNGHLVVATLHGKSVESAIRRMLTLSSDRSHGMDDIHAREMLSDCLRAVVNQRLFWELGGDGRWSSGSVKGEVLWSGGYSSIVARAVREMNQGALGVMARAQTAAIAAAPSEHDLPSMLERAAEEAFGQREGDRARRAHD